MYLHFGLKIMFFYQHFLSHLPRRLSQCGLLFVALALNLGLVSIAGTGVVQWERFKSIQPLKLIGF